MGLRSEVLLRPHFAISGQFSHNPACPVDFEPFTTSHFVVFAIIVRMGPHVVWLHARFTATYADRRGATNEWRGPVILRPKDYLSMSISESVLFVDHGANESVRELISPIVDTRNALYDHVPFSIDVHPPVPGVALMVYLR